MSNCSVRDLDEIVGPLENVESADFPLERVLERQRGLHLGHKIRRNRQQKDTSLQIQAQNLHRNRSSDLTKIKRQKIKFKFKI